MLLKNICTSAPGSIMLLGEHAVLLGEQAMVAAVNQRIQVELIPQTHHDIVIHSDRLGRFSVPINQLEIRPPFQFILAACKLYQMQLPSGCEIHIKSQFAENLGLGSSAAVTVATLAAIYRWLDIPYEEKKFIEQAIQIVRTAQGLGSGADIAASTLGGVIAFRSQPLEFEKLNQYFSLSLVYSGYKKPTVEVVKMVQQFAQQEPELFARIKLAIGQCANKGIEAVKQQNWPRLGEIFNEQSQLMAELKLADNHIADLIQILNSFPVILGAKISGSGLGDCVVALGEIPLDYFPRDEAQEKKGVKQIDIQIETEGLRYE